MFGLTHCITKSCSRVVSHNANALCRTRHLSLVTKDGNTSLSHVDADKALPRMVNVSSKPTSKRSATARGIVRFPPHVFEMLKSSGYESPKGPIIATAVIAGVQAAKKTSELIPFCHHVPLDGCDISITEEAPPGSVTGGTDAAASIPHALHIQCTAHAMYRTGIEMEALVGVSAAALCLYDMTKAASHDIQITDIALVHKAGGKSGDIQLPYRPSVPSAASGRS